MIKQDNVRQFHAQDNEFATESVEKLILRFAIPGIISLLVNSLYNIVDQVFIGHGVGYLGNAATNVAFPMVTIALAVALLIGTGCATSFSLKLGADRKDEAERSVGNAVMLLLSSGLLLMVLGLAFLEPLLRLFGATDLVLPYAVPYAGICLVGLPFVILATGLNNIIRADGSPGYAMVSMLVGAGINVVLDPIFIFTFEMGVTGAAIATIIGQIVTCIVSVRYIWHFRNIQFRKKYMRLQGPLCRRIFILGASSFLTQIAIVLVQIVMNNTLTYYGGLSPYGQEIPLACIGIVMKVSQILMAFLIGMSIGAQPIVGFNYGAGNYARVKQTYKISVKMATGFALCGWLLFELFPYQIMALFGKENQLYTDFAVKCFRIFLFFIFTAGFQIVSANFFQAIGKPVKAAGLSLSRQVLLLIPLLLVLPIFFGLEGVLFAGPAADSMAAVLTAYFIIRELKQLGQGSLEAGR